MSENTFLLYVWLVIPSKWMNFVGMEPCSCGNSSILLLWGASVIRCHGGIHEIFDESNRNIIDKICYCEPRMNEPSLNDSKNLWFLTLYKCVLVDLLHNVVRSLLSAGGYLYNIHMCGIKPWYPDHYAATVNQVHVENLPLEVCYQVRLESRSQQESWNLGYSNYTGSYYTT